MSTSTSLLLFKSLSHVLLFVTPWTVAHQVPLSMGFPKQEYWSGLTFPPPGDIPDPGIEPTSPELAGRFVTRVTWEAQPLFLPPILAFIALFCFDWFLILQSIRISILFGTAISQLDSGLTMLAWEPVYHSQENSSHPKQLTSKAENIICL